MQTEEYYSIERLENTHFWYKAMHELILDQATKQIKQNTAILDAGCGTGTLAADLEKLGPVTAIDVSPVALGFSSQKKISRVREASVCDLPFNDSVFGLITCLDVLYHKGVRDDNTALREFYRVMKPNGSLILRLPAFKFLWGDHDVIVHTKRRYTTEEVREKVVNAGFKIEKLTYLNMILGVPLAIKRVSERLKRVKKKQSDSVLLPKLINSFCYQILKTENSLINYLSLPFGSSVYCLAKKM